MEAFGYLVDNRLDLLVKLGLKTTAMELKSAIVWVYVHSLRFAGYPKNDLGAQLVDEYLDWLFSQQQVYLLKCFVPFSSDQSQMKHICRIVTRFTIPRDIAGSIRDIVQMFASLGAEIKPNDIMAAVFDDICQRVSDNYDPLN